MFEQIVPPLCTPYFSNAKLFMQDHEQKFPVVWNVFFDASYAYGISRRWVLKS